MRLHASALQRPRCPGGPGGFGGLRRAPWRRWWPALRRALRLTLRLTLPLALPLGLAACADTGGLGNRATLTAPASLGMSEGALSDARWPADDWWRGFADPSLDALVGRALSDHPSLQVAQARLDGAYGAQALAGSASTPRVGLLVDSITQRYSQTGSAPLLLAGQVVTQNSAVTTFNWELDFFGRNSAALQATIGRSRAAEAEVFAARNLLAAQVALQYFQLARHQSQRDLAVRLLAQREQVEELLTRRARAGLDSDLERQQALAITAQTRQQIESYDEQVALSRHALAALTAQPAHALAGLRATLPGPGPQALPPVIPADLLGRRADLVAARWRVEAAARDRDATRALFYPNVNLVGFAGFSSLGFAKLFSSGSLVYAIGPAIRLPLFDGERLRAQLQGAGADLDEAIGQYNATLTDAAREAADQIASLRSLAVQRDELGRALQASSQAHAMALGRFRAGLSGYLTVLSVEATWLGQQQSAIDAAAREARAHVELTRALGGGFRGELPPDPGSTR